MALSAFPLVLSHPRPADTHAALALRGMPTSVPVAAQSSAMPPTMPATYAATWGGGLSVATSATSAGLFHKAGGGGYHEVGFGHVGVEAQPVWSAWRQSSPAKPFAPSQ